MSGALSETSFSFSFFRVRPQKNARKSAKARESARERERAKESAGRLFFLVCFSVFLFLKVRGRHKDGAGASYIACVAGIACIAYVVEFEARACVVTERCTTRAPAAAAASSSLLRTTSEWAAQEEGKGSAHRLSHTSRS